MTQIALDKACDLCHNIFTILLTQQQSCSLLQVCILGEKLMGAIDFSNYSTNTIYYGGSEKKIGITVGDNRYMLKFRKKTAFGTRNNHISEYIGSRIFGLLGFDVQETYLGTYNGEEVVACRDFNVAGKQFVPFNDVGESTLEHDKERYQYSYEDIMKMLRDNSKLTNVEDTIAMFWRIYIVDAFLGNFDRHGANWGFMKENNTYTLAPIFDNGSCLFPNMTDMDDMMTVINSREETDKRVYSFPTSQIQLNGKKSSYYDVINSLSYDECNKALEYVHNRIDMNQIRNLVDNTPLINDVQRQFYKHMLDARYNAIIDASFRKLQVR